MNRLRRFLYVWVTMRVEFIATDETACQNTESSWVEECRFVEPVGATIR